MSDLIWELGDGVQKDVTRTEAMNQTRSHLEGLGEVCFPLPKRYEIETWYILVLINILIYTNAYEIVPLFPAADMSRPDSWNYSIHLITTRRCSQMKGWKIFKSHAWLPSWLNQPKGHDTSRLFVTQRNKCLYWWTNLSWEFVPSNQKHPNRQTFPSSP